MKVKYIILIFGTKGNILKWFYLKSKREEIQNLLKVKSTDDSDEIPNNFKIKLKNLLGNNENQTFEKTK